MGEVHFLKCYFSWRRLWAHFLCSSFWLLGVSIVFDFGVLFGRLVILESHIVWLIGGSKEEEEEFQKWEK